MSTLDELLNEAESQIPNFETIKPSVSRVPVAWQLHHLLSVIIRVSEILAKSDPKEYKANFNLSRTVIFLMGKIPRGAGKSPKAVNKLEPISKKEIEELIVEARTLTLKHHQLDSRANFPHPIFGLLTKKQSLYFLEIHTKHHLKIIQDILK